MSLTTAKGRKVRTRGGEVLLTAGGVEFSIGGLQQDQDGYWDAYHCEDTLTAGFKSEEEAALYVANTYERAVLDTPALADIDTAPEAQQDEQDAEAYIADQYGANDLLEAERIAVTYAYLHARRTAR